MEHDLERSLENIVEAVLLLGRTLHKALECICLRSLLYLLGGNYLLEAMFLTSALNFTFTLLTQIKLGAYEDAGA